MFLGELAALSNGAVWATTGVISKRLGREVRPLHIVTAQMWSSLLLLSLVALVTGQFGDIFRTPGDAALALIAASLINTVGSLTFWMALSRGAVSRVYPTTQSLFILASMAAGWIFLDDAPKVAVIGGAALIIGGVVLLNRGTRGSAESAGRRAELIALALSVLTALLWATAFVVTAGALEEADPLPATIMRNALPALLLAVVAWFAPRPRIVRVYRANWRRMAVIGVLLAYLEFSFVFALDRTSPGVAAVLINTSPMFAVVLAWLVLRESLTRNAVAGIALSVGGIFAVLAFS